MSKVWKSHHYISYGKTISQRTINNIGNYFIKLSSWKYYSITSFMRLKYKNVSEEDKRKIIQEIYNLMNLSCMCNVFKFVNNKGIVIMNESEITTNIIIYLKKNYDKVNSEMETFNGTLGPKRFDTFMKNVHTA